MANPIMKNVDAAETAEESYGCVIENVCAICAYDGICEVKYKGTCKIARAIRLRLYKGGMPKVGGQTPAEKLNTLRDEVRKETAKEILQRVYDCCEMRVDERIHKNTIKNFAKEYGVEVDA